MLPNFPEQALLRLLETPFDPKARRVAVPSPAENLGHEVDVDAAPGPQAYSKPVPLVLLQEHGYFHPFDQ